MEFKLQEDIEAPIDDVFAVVSDAELLERSGMRRGIHSERKDPNAPVGVGSEWIVTFGFRGVERKANVRLNRVESPNVVGFSNETDGLDVPVEVELIALSKDSTRMTLNLALKPRTLSARLLVQSLKLARGTLDKKLNSRMSAIARDIEGRIAKAS